jgi:hypothetical protein
MEINRRAFIVGGTLTGLGKGEAKAQNLNISPEEFESINKTFNFRVEEGIKRLETILCGHDLSVINPEEADYLFSKKWAQLIEMGGEHNLLIDQARNEKNEPLRQKKIKETIEFQEKYNKYGEELVGELEATDFKLQKSKLIPVVINRNLKGIVIPSCIM